jgi:hypothetical protein
MSKDSIFDWFAKIGVLLGLVTALVTFIPNLLNLVQATQGLRVVAFAGFCLYALATVWLVFKATGISPRWRWISLGLLYLVTGAFFYWVGTWIKQAPNPPGTPSNLTWRMDFEREAPQSLSLGVCDNTLSPWYDHCYNAPERLRLVSGGFTGENSLECQMEALPDKEQVYTLRLPINPPVFVDAVSAAVYNVHPDRFARISLAAHPKGKDFWIFSDFTPREGGWLRLLTDVQSFKESAGGSVEEIAVDEVHIDIFLKKGQSESSVEKVLIDDIELYYPLAPPLKTGP